MELKHEEINNQLMSPRLTFWGLFKQVKMKGIEEKGANVES